MTIDKLFEMLSIFAGLLSAVLWTRAATAVVRDSRPDNHYRDGSTVTGGTDFFATARPQATWNRWAAFAAATAAAAQVFSKIIA